MNQPLSAVRRSIFPVEGDTWESIAARELGGQEATAAVGQLQSWNLHVFMRRSPPEGSPRHGNPILPSDVIFIEPPKAAG